MSHLNTDELNSKFFQNKVYFKAMATKICNNEKNIYEIIKNQNNESIISILAEYENKIDNLQKKLNSLEEKINSLEQIS